jgi:serine phosphatase RsbU (regulator of sigma subunit)
MADQAPAARYCNSLPGLNRLLEVTRLLADEIDTPHALATIAAEAAKALHCERAVVFRFDAKRHELVATAGTQHELTVPLDRALPEYIVQVRGLVNIADAARDNRWDPLYDQLAGVPTRTALVVPLVASRDDRLLGMLAMLNNIGGPFDADDEALALAFSSHAAAALDRARLVAEINQRRELEASLHVAREVQRRFMPSKLPAIDGYEVATWWFPYEAVGGDYCDVIPMASGDVALTIADVSGHGLGPSLLMASVRAALRTLLLAHDSPQVLLEQLARALADDFEHGSFITMFLAKLAPEMHEFSFANAGHGPALMLKATGEFIDLESTGLPLGVVIPTDYPLGPRISMQPGDLMLLATDGIVESFDKRGQQFGVQRLKELITRLSRGPLKELVRTIGHEVEQHYVGESPPDDLTLLALRRT